VEARSPNHAAWLSEGCLCLHLFVAGRVLCVIVCVLCPQGLACILPVDLLPMFTPWEAEALVCGQPTIDVSLLRRVAEYVSSLHTVYLLFLRSV